MKTNLTVPQMIKAVEKLKVEKAEAQEQFAGRLTRDAIRRATPWEVNLNRPHHSTRKFLRLVFSAWVLGILVVLAFMVGDRIVNRDVVPSAPVVELPL